MDTSSESGLVLNSVGDIDMILNLKQSSNISKNERKCQLKN